MNRAVSAVSSVPAVRTASSRNSARSPPRPIASSRAATLVPWFFPETRYKFYLDAKPEVRQLRRNAQGQQDEVTARDRFDSSRHTAPLTIAADATVIDTTEMNLTEVVAAVQTALATQGLLACPRG